MFMTRAQLKADAMQQISGTIGTFFLIAILTVLISATGIGVLVIPAINISVIALFLNLTNGVRPTVGGMFCRIDAFGKALWLQIITNFFVSLWSLLFVIPGIVKTVSYAMAPYILAENPDMTAREALNASKELMDGHKMDLFVLNLSFIGWILLTGITYGLAAIYVAPYMSATHANFYNAIKRHVRIEG